MSLPKACPACGTSFKGKRIPKKYQHLYASTHYSRVIGMEDPTVYDGIIEWRCPDCLYCWGRFPNKAKGVK